MEIVIIILLIVINGMFAMAEIAIISAKKSRLQKAANEGSKNAQAALELSTNPNKFLSTIQIGITLVGILAGAFGGATVAEQLAKSWRDIPIIGQYSEVLALAIVVTVITFLSLVIGELVPKRIALTKPESLASALSPSMVIISRIFSPIIVLLSTSTDWILRILGVKQEEADITVSEEELKILIKEGARVGVFEVVEKDIFERTLRLGDKKVSALMTPRNDIIWLDISGSFTSTRKKVLQELHSHFPVCKDTIDNFKGVIVTREALAQFLKEGEIRIEELLRKPATVPENMLALNVLELFKKTGVHIAMVVDEYGNMEGLITLNDILEAIVGDIPSVDEMREKDIMKRKDGSYLVDGMVTLDELKEKLRIKRLRGEKTGGFNTVGGFVMHSLGRVPVPGDFFEEDELRFEVVDMDGNRVDKVLITKRHLRT